MISRPFKVHPLQEEPVYIFGSSILFREKDQEKAYLRFTNYDKHDRHKLFSLPKTHQEIYD